jgi:hypothetical protein
MLVTRSIAIGSSAQSDGISKGESSFKLTYRMGGALDWTGSLTRIGEITSSADLMARYNGTIVQWRSKMQKIWFKIISLSTAEAEYYAASEMAIEAIYTTTSSKT